MQQWVKDIYYLTLKENREIKDLAIFSNEPDEAFVMEFGNWWENLFADKRYIPIQEYINSRINLNDPKMDDIGLYMGAKRE